MAGTSDEASLLAATVRERGLESAVLVSSPYHTRRVSRTFDRVLPAQVEISVCPVPFERSASPLPSRRWLHPRGWNDVALEWVKLVGYEIRSR